MGLTMNFVPKLAEIRIVSKGDEAVVSKDGANRNPTFILNTSNLSEIVLQTLEAQIYEKTDLKNQDVEGASINLILYSNPSRYCCPNNQHDCRGLIFAAGI